MVIAIDGTVSAGKSTISKMLAQKLGYLHLNTGAIYRAITLKIIESNHENAGQDEITKLLKTTSIEQKMNDDRKTIVFLDGKDVSDKIITPEISNKVADYAIYPKVREYVRKIQRQVAANGNCIVEGRDIGTIVLPDADVKFFITAPAEIRAMRRFKDYEKQHKRVDYKNVLKDLLLRDKKDMEREVSPLKMTENSIAINNIADTPQIAVDEMIKICEKINN